MRVAALVATVMLVGSAAVLAQQPAVPSIPTAGPLAAALSGALQRAGRNMPGAADLMPADKFGFKPTPEQMSFGEIIGHEAESNETLCAALGGSSATPTESAAGATAPKEQLVARIRQSFGSCRAVVRGPEPMGGVPYLRSS